MVVRTRLRSIVVPIVFYLVLGVATGYLVWGASNGAHGLKAAEKDAAQAVALRLQLAALKEERARWERRVDGARGPTASTATCSTRRRTSSSIGSARTRS